MEMTFSFVMAGQIEKPEDEKLLLADTKKLCEKYKETLAYANWKGSHTGEEIIKG